MNIEKLYLIPKKNSVLTLNKESKNIINELSKQLGATPKKIIEALIKNINLEDGSELLKIDQSISGKRSIEKNLALENDFKLEEDIKFEEDAKLEEVQEIGSKKKVDRKRQAATLLSLRMSSKK